MMTRTPYIHIAAAGLLFILALGAYLLWFRHVSALSTQATELSAQLKTLGDAGGRASSVRRELEDVKNREESVYRHFVGSDTIVSYLGEIEDTGKSLGAAVEVVSVADAQAAQGQSPQLQMSLRITGPFDAVMRTLGAIEYQPYDATLSSLVLDTPPTADANWTAAATFLVGTPPKP
ncbi:MAG: hypothetical protein QOE22_506 [Candidatus Parcubacteria bacterium]|jgi:hypothetical protein|nr:hypothetical protein [Candidatus Parcubacteria bacterium]